MIKVVKLAVLISAIPFIALMFENRSPNVGGQSAPTAGQKFKNIKVLNDVPADDIGKIMNIMGQSLGVDCSFCHTGYDFEKEGKEEKDVAREMIKMTFELNQKYFGGEMEVSCSTCHNGRPHPRTAPDLNAIKSSPRIKQPEVKPDVGEIFKKYLRAMRVSGVKPKGLTIKARRIEPDGKTTEPEEITYATDKLLIKTTYEPKYVVVEGFDGTTAWKTGNGSRIALKPDEAFEIRRSAQMFAQTDLSAIYPLLEFEKLDRIEGREVYVVKAKGENGITERLFFDTLNALLVRRTATTNTALGPFIYQVDLSEYRNFGGVKLPATARVAMPGISFTRKILSVKAVNIDGIVFTEPQYNLITKGAKGNE